MPNLPAKTGLLFELEKRFQVQWRALVASACLAPTFVAVASCAPVPLSDGERRVALRSTTEQVILPTYQELSDRSAELAALLAELAAHPSETNLDEVRQAYADARAPLEEAQAFGFGPAADLHATAGLDQAPTDTAKLDSELASQKELTVEYVADLGANKRGLHAIEYLLFPADADVDAALMADDTAGERRRQFLSSAADVVAAKAAELLAAWQPEQGDYSGRFTQPGGPDSASTTVQAGLDTLLNETVVLCEVMANVKLGRPLGITTGKVDPSAQESERSGLSLDDLRSNLSGIRNIYLGSRDGTQGSSLSRLVHGKSPSTDLHARTALADAEAALAAVPDPLTRALSDAPESVNAAYDAVRALKRVLATEVLGTLGASLKFSDNDGD